MNATTSSIPGGAAVSGGVAASIAMTVSCIVVIIVTGDPGLALTWGAWCAAVAFGATFAGIFLITVAQRGRSSA